MKARSFFLKSIGLLLFIGLFIYASPGDVIESLQRADLALLSFAGGFALTGVVVKNVRWRYILSLSGGHIRWRDLVPLAFISAFFGNVTPGRFGDLWKISFADSATFSRSQGLISFVYDRLLDACTMAILALIGTLAIDHFRNAAFAGMLYAGRLQGARYTLGEADLLTVIAATVIGGTSMFGGKGSIIGALMGSLLMGVLNNGLLLKGLSVSEQLVARGVIIILAVALSLREARA